MLKILDTLVTQVKGTGTANAPQVVRLLPAAVIDASSVAATLQLISFTGTTPIVPGAVAAGSVLRITLASNAVYTLNAPAVAGTSGALLTVQVRNALGGAAGAMTFAALFKIGAAWTQPANGFSRTIQFLSDGTNWVEISRTAADVAN